MENEKTPPLPLPEAVQNYVLDAFGGDDGPENGRDLLLSLARRVAYARAVHPRFGGMASVCGEFDELKLAFVGFGTGGGSYLRMREEALDVMATCVRLINLEDSADGEERPCP